MATEFIAKAVTPEDGRGRGAFRFRFRGGTPGQHELVTGRGAQWKESPQAQAPVAFGLSIVKPCFSIVSTKSMEAPPR